MIESKMRIRGSFPAARGRSLGVLFIAAAALAAAASASQAQVELKTYADAKGYLNVRTLTCAQLAGTFQEDADFLGTWYSGWYNGHMKRHSINPTRVKAGIHQVIEYCKANPDKKVVDAVANFVKQVKSGDK